MATAKKLPSGQWRCRAFVGTDPSGQKHTMSFTASTKREAELKAAQYAAEYKGQRRTDNLTVAEAIDRYITAKAAVLSPSTIREYRGMQRRYYGGISEKKIHSLITEDMQLFISGLTDKVSAKTVTNAYGLLSSSVAMFRPDAVFRVTLPRKSKKRRVSPSDEDIRALFDAAGHELKICIALSAYGSLRRGEICALKHSDITGNTVRVHADMVMDENYKFVYKDYPKTSESIREVLLPPEVVDLIGDGVEDAFIVTLSPATVTCSFIRLRNRLDLPEIRFHDLRHYYASIGAVLGIPDTYLSAFGGWSPASPIMKQTYQNCITDMATDYAQTMSNHFSSLINAGDSV